MSLQVLSLWQPWSSLVAHGEKHIETRSWAFRGGLPAFLAIHAAKKWNGSLNATAFCSEPIASALALHGIEEKKALPFGAVVAVVRLVECVSTDYAKAYPTLSCLAGKYLSAFRNERAFGDYSYGRYAWVFDKHLLLDKPIPMVGHQGLWNWDKPPAEVVAWMEENTIKGAL